MLRIGYLILKKFINFIFKIIHNPTAFDGVLTIRLAWLIEALQLLIGFIKESLQKKKFKKDLKKQTSSQTLSASLTPIQQQQQLETQTFFNDFIKFFERFSLALIYKHFGFF